MLCARITFLLLVLVANFNVFASMQACDAAKVASTWELRWELVRRHSDFTRRDVQTLHCVSKSLEACSHYVTGVHINELRAYTRSIYSGPCVWFLKEPRCAYIETLGMPGKEGGTCKTLVSISQYGGKPVEHEIALSDSFDQVPAHAQKPFFISERAYAYEDYADHEDKACRLVGVDSVGGICHAFMYVRLLEGHIVPNGFLSFTAPKLQAALVDHGTWTLHKKDSKMFRSKVRRSQQEQIDHILIGNVQSLNCISKKDKELLSTWMSPLHYEPILDITIESIADLIPLSHVGIGHMLYSWGIPEQRAHLLQYLGALHFISYKISDYGTFSIHPWHSRVCFQRKRKRDVLNPFIAGARPITILPAVTYCTAALAYLEKQNVFVKKDWAEHKEQLKAACDKLHTKRFVFVSTDTHAAIIDTIAWKAHVIELVRRPKKEPQLQGSYNLPHHANPEKVTLEDDGGLVFKCDSH